MSAGPVARGHDGVRGAVERPGLRAAVGARDDRRPDAWQVATGRGITIAIVDSGIALSRGPAGRQDRRCRVVPRHQRRRDGLRARRRGRRRSRHHVAGIAAATKGNGKGIAGVAPDASLLAVKVLRHGCNALDDCTASGTGDDVSAGIRYAADHGADVINLSLGSTTQAVLGVSFTDALEYAWSKGAIPVVAAGNDYVLPSGFSNQHAVDRRRAEPRRQQSGLLERGGPGDVGAVRRAARATRRTAATAPDGHPLDVLDTRRAGRGYACLAGTSMAAPHVADALAVLRSSGVDRSRPSTGCWQPLDLGSPGPRYDVRRRSARPRRRRRARIDTDHRGRDAALGPSSAPGDTTSTDPSTSATPPGTSSPPSSGPGCRRAARHR